jgi:hypothetical protein
MCDLNLNVSGVSQEPVTRTSHSASFLGNSDTKHELKNTQGSKVSVSDYSPNGWTHKGELNLSR